MRTLYLRNVPDDVAVRLERLATEAGMSVSTFAVRELIEVSRRADNAALLGALPSVAVELDSVINALERARAER